MKRFKPGQEITPRNSVQWTALDGKVSNCLPERGKIYTVRDYTSFISRFGWFIRLAELSPDDEYEESEFEPVISTSILEKELATIPELQTV